MPIGSQSPITSNPMSTHPPQSKLRVNCLGISRDG